MVLSGLFCQIVLDFHNTYDEHFNEKYELKNYDSDLKTIYGVIDTMYKDNDTDIEDFYDLIWSIHQCCLDIVQSRLFSQDQGDQFMKLRIYAKKQVKHKYRDYKYHQRRFWNDEEADFQYKSGKEQWQETVKQLIEVVQLTK